MIQTFFFSAQVRLLFSFILFQLTMTSALGQSFSEDFPIEDNWDLSITNEQHLVRITTDMDRKLTFNLSVEFDEEHGAIRMHNRDGKDVHSFETSELKNKVVIYRSSGKDVIVLSSSNFDPHTGGQIKISFLRNAINNLRGEFLMRLELIDNKWTLTSDEPKTQSLILQTLFLKTNKVFGRIVGIDRVIPNYTEVLDDILPYYGEEEFLESL